MKTDEEEKVAEALRLRLQVMKLAQAVPRGRVISYGALGNAASRRCRVILWPRHAQVLDDVPWWRVVGKDGTLPISKRGPRHAARQRELLGEEGVEFDNDGRVLKSFFES